MISLRKILQTSLYLSIHFFVIRYDHDDGFDHDDEVILQQLIAPGEWTEEAKV